MSCALRSIQYEIEPGSVDIAVKNIDIMLTTYPKFFQESSG